MKDLEFREGLLELEKLQFILFPINSFLSIFYELLKHYSNEEIHTILCSATYKDAKIYYNNFSGKKYKEIDLIKFYLKHINSYGLGEIKLKLISKTCIVFYFEDNFLSRFYSLFFKDKSKFLFEQIQINFLYNFLKEVYKSDFDLSISNKNRTIWVKYKFIKNENFIKKKENFNYNINKNYKSNKILKKVLSNNHLIFKGGTINL